MSEQRPDDRERKGGDATGSRGAEPEASTDATSAEAARTGPGSPEPGASSSGGREPTPTSGRGAAAPGDEEGTEADQEAPERPRTPVTQQIGRVVVLLLLVLFGVFAASNAQRVDFSWVFGATEVTRTPAGETSGGVPLIVLLLLAFAVGAIVGGAAAWQSARSRRRSREEAGDGPRGRG